MPEELIAACHALEMPAMALLDRDGVYGRAAFSSGGEEEWNQGAYRRGNYSLKSQVSSLKL